MGECYRIARHQLPEEARSSLALLSDAQFNVTLQVENISPENFTMLKTYLEVLENRQPVANEIKRPGPSDKGFCWQGQLIDDDTECVLEELRTRLGGKGARVSYKISAPKWVE